MEVVRKYNQELKMLNDDNTIKAKLFKEKSSVAQTTSETQTINNEFCVEKEANTDTICSETETDTELSIIRSKLVSIKFILDETGPENPNEDLTIEVLLVNIASLVKDLKIDSKSRITELKHLKSQNSKLMIDYKTLKESKIKLESLYKIKCKSDLNKSAQIKKLEINYQLELIKFRNEFNSDLVRYLETKLLRKESLLSENFNQLSAVLSLILKLSESKEEKVDSSGEQESILLMNLKNKLENLREPIKCLLNSNLFSQTDSYAFSERNNNNTNNSSGAEFKKIPLNLTGKCANSDLLKCLPTVSFFLLKKNIKLSFLLISFF